MKTLDRNSDAHWWKQKAWTERVLGTEKKRARVLLCTITSFLILASTSSMAGASIEVLPERLCFVVKEDGDITYKVRVRGDVPTYASFEIVYKPEAIQVRGLDKLNYPGVWDLDVTLELPEGTYAETKELCQELTEEKIRNLEMKGKRVSKRRLPSMSMRSKLEILITGSSGDVGTITIPLKVIFDFSEKNKRISSVYVE